MANMIEFRREQFIETLVDNDALLADGFEEALIGHTQGSNVVAVYDYELCVQVLMERDSMTAHDGLQCSWLLRRGQDTCLYLYGVKRVGLCWVSQLHYLGYVTPV